MEPHQLLNSFKRELQYMEGRDISQTELAAEIGIPRDMLARYMNENAKGNPKGEPGIKLANYFVSKFGARGLLIYDSLGWDRPILPSEEN